MAATAENPLVERVQELTARLEEVADPEVRGLAEDLAASVVHLYGEGLERIFSVLDEATRERLAADGVVGSLMLIHGMYPVPLEARVQEALDSVRPYLDSHGGDVELLGIEDGVARLRLNGSCDGCMASASTLELAIEAALEDTAPDLLGLEVQGVVPAAPMPSAPAAAEWVALEGADALGRGHKAVLDELMVANVAGTLLAYRDRCAGCGASLRDAVLLGGTLTCVACSEAFDLPRAGRSKNGAGLQLQPVPLLRGAGGVRVAAAP